MRGLREKTPVGWPFTFYLRGSKDVFYLVLETIVGKSGRVTGTYRAQDLLVQTTDMRARFGYESTSSPVGKSQVLTRGILSTLPSMLREPLHSRTTSETPSLSSRKLNWGECPVSRPLSCLTYLLRRGKKNEISLPLPVNGTLRCPSYSYLSTDNKTRLKTVLRPT